MNNNEISNLDEYIAEEDADGVHYYDPTNYPVQRNEVYFEPWGMDDDDEDTDEEDEDSDNDQIPKELKNDGDDGPNLTEKPEDGLEKLGTDAENAGKLGTEGAETAGEGLVEGGELAGSAAGTAAVGEGAGVAAGAAGAGGAAAGGEIVAGGAAVAAAPEVGVAVAIVAAVIAVVAIVVVLALLIFSAFMGASPDQASAVGNTNTTVSAPPPSTTIYGKIPLFKQWDPRWGKSSYGCGETISSAGCGVTSLAMIITYYTGKELLPSETAKISMSHGWRICGSGTSWSAMTEMPKMYGLKAKQVSWSEAKKYLASGVPIIQSQGPGYFTNGGHFIVVTGVSGGKYTINDPDGKHRTTATESQITSALKASWAIYK